MKKYIVLFAIILTFTSSSWADSLSCIYKDPAGNYYDFTPLSNVTVSASIGVLTYKFYVTPCATTPQNSKTVKPCARVNSPAIQIDQESNCVYLADLSTQTFSKTLDGLIVIDYENGQPCGDVSRTTRISFMCDPNTESNLYQVQTDHPDICQYEFDWKTKYACKGYIPGYFFFKKSTGELYRSNYGDFQNKTIIYKGDVSNLRVERKSKRLYYINSQINAIYTMNFDGTDNKMFYYIGPGSSVYSLATSFGRVMFNVYTSSRDEMYICGGSLNSSKDCVKIFNGYQTGIRALAGDSTNYLFFSMYDTSPGRYKTKAVSFNDLDDKEFNAKTIFTDNDIVKIVGVSEDLVIYYNGASIKQSYKGQISIVQETVMSMYAMTVDPFGKELFWTAAGIDTNLIKQCSINAGARDCKIIYKDSVAISEFAVYTN